MGLMRLMGPMGVAGELPPTANCKLPTANRQPPTLLRDGSHGFAAAFVGFFGWMTGWHGNPLGGGEIG